MYEKGYLKNGIPDGFKDNLEGGRDESVHVADGGIQGILQLETAGLSGSVEVADAHSICFVENLPFVAGLHLALEKNALDVLGAVVSDESPVSNLDAVLDGPGCPDEKCHEETAKKHL